MLLRGPRNCDGTPTTVEPLPDDQITTRPLETAPLDQLAIQRITIIAAAAGRSIVVLSILTVPAALELIRRYHRSGWNSLSHVTGGMLLQADAAMAAAARLKPPYCSHG
jgi:hypothetical protein